MIKKNIILALLGGICIGIAILLLIAATVHAESAFLLLSYRWPFAPIVITPMGFVLIAWLVRRFFKGAQGSGIPQTVSAVKFPYSANSKEYLSLPALLGKYLIIPAYLCGGSLGYEGPAVQIGAGIMATLQKYLGVQKDYLQRSLIIAGGAAGLAAAFCAPLTGIVFALEELIRDHKWSTMSYLLIVVVISVLICDLPIGHYTFLGHSMDTGMVSLHGYGYLWVLICGILGGFAGSIFSLVLLYISKKCYAFTHRRPVITAAIAGLLVAVVGLLSGGHTAGCGEAEVRAIAEGQSLPFFYAPLKMLATLFTYLAGIPVGLFAPSIAIGAGFGQLLDPLLPASVMPHAVMLLMMTAYLCGVIQAPLTSFVVIMEISGQETMLLPLIMTSLIAKIVARLLLRRPLYDSQLLLARIRQQNQSM